MARRITAGIDIGSSHAKCALINNWGEVSGHAVQRSGIDFGRAAGEVLARALDMAGVEREAVEAVFATGYGRKNVEFADDARTEIACHGKGCYHYFPNRALTIIDIGGQDNKVIKLGPDGKRRSFKMNRKCAAGTGAFLEEMALRLDLPLTDLNGLASGASGEVTMGSFCTVFTATEVLEKIRQGKRVDDIVRGLFRSVIKRVLEMDTMTGTVVLTGGVVAHNPYLRELLAESAGVPIEVPPLPQLTGAIGAALLALNSGKSGSGRV